MSNYHFCYSRDAIKHCIDTLCRQYLCLVSFMPYDFTFCSYHFHWIERQIDVCCDKRNLYEILIMVEEKKFARYGVINLIWDESQFVEVSKEDGIKRFGSDYKVLSDYEVIKKILDQCCDTTIIHGASDLIN